MATGTVGQGWINTAYWDWGGGTRVDKQHGLLGLWGGTRVDKQHERQLDVTDSTQGKKEGNVLFNDTLNTFYLVIWHRTYGKGPFR